MRVKHVRVILWLVFVGLLGATVAVGYFGMQGPTRARTETVDDQALLQALSNASLDVDLPQLAWDFMKEKRAAAAPMLPEIPFEDPALEKELARYITVITTAVAPSFACAWLLEGNPANRKEPQKNRVRKVGDETTPGAVVTAVEGKTVTFQYKDTAITLEAEKGRIPVVVHAPPPVRPESGRRRIPRLEDLPPFERGEFLDRARRVRMFQDWRRRRTVREGLGVEDDFDPDLHPLEGLGLELPE